MHSSAMKSLVVFVALVGLATATDSASCGDTSGLAYQSTECFCGTDTTTAGTANCGSSTFGYYCNAGTCSSSSSFLSDCDSMTDDDWKNFASNVMGAAIFATICAAVGCVIASAITCQCTDALNKPAKVVALIAFACGIVGLLVPWFAIGPACDSMAEEACGAFTKGDGSDSDVIAGLCRVGGFFKVYLNPSAPVGLIALGFAVGAFVCCFLVLCQCCKYGEAMKKANEQPAAAGVVVQGVAQPVQGVVAQPTTMVPQNPPKM